jgi:hypothetical protein
LSTLLDLLPAIWMVLATFMVALIVFWGIALLGLYLVQDYERREFEDMARDYDQRLAGAANYDDEHLEP